MKCRSCGSRPQLEVSFTLGDGTRLAFSRCPTCETKRWEGPDGEVSRDQALKLTAAHVPKR